MPSPRPNTVGQATPLDMRGRQLSTISKEMHSPTGTQWSRSSSPSVRLPQTKTGAQMLALTSVFDLHPRANQIWPNSITGWKIRDLRSQLCPTTGTSKGCDHLISTIGPNNLHAAKITDFQLSTVINVRPLWDGPCDKPNVASRLSAIQHWVFAAAHMDEVPAEGPDPLFYALKAKYLQTLCWLLRATQKLLATVTGLDKAAYTLKGQLGIFNSMGNLESSNNVLQSAAILLSRLELAKVWMEDMFLCVFAPAL